MRRLTRTETLAGAAQAARRTYQTNRHERLPAAEAQLQSLQRLRDVVDHAYRTVPFYRDLYRAVGYEPGELRSFQDLTSLPVITKSELMAEPRHRLISDTVPERRLLPSVTSGSTGEILTVWHDAARLGQLGLAILRVTGLNVSHRPWYRTLYVYTSPWPIRSVFGLYPFHFVATTDPPSVIAAKWRKVRPAVVWIYPSRLRDLLDELGDLPPARLVSVGSELSTTTERRRWEARLQTPVRDQYGTEELGMVAAECAHRNRHVFSDLCHIEVLDRHGQKAAPGEVGDVVGTNLENKAMPIIRYRQGDRAALALRSCDCGRTLPILDPIEGRGRVDLRTPNGVRVGSGVVIDALYGLILDLELPVAGYQVVAGDPIELLLKGSLSDRQIQAAVAFINDQTGLVVEPRVVTELPLGPTGKREMVWTRSSQPVSREIENIDHQPRQDIEDEDRARPATDGTP